MSRKTTITGRGIRDETIEAIDIASGSIHADELAEQAISGQPTATAVNQANDRLLIWDADGSLSGTLKQVSPSALGVTLLLSGAQHDGTQVSVNQPSRITFADTTGLFAEETATGQVKIEVGSHFNPIAVAGQSDVAASGESQLNLAAGDNITITTNNSTKTITFDAASGGSGGWTDDGSVVRLATSTDSVGVGTSSPQTILHVNSASNLPGEITVSIENANITANSPIGQITFSGAESSPSFAAGAHIIGEASENWSVGSAEGTALLFCTKGNGTTGDPTERMIIDHNGNVGIGTVSPAEELHVKGTDPRIRIEASAGNHPGVELSENGTRKWIMYNDPANDMLRYKALSDTNDTFSFERIADGQGQLRLTQIGYTDGAGAIDILSGGALRFNNGVKASPGVKVNSSLTDSDDQWIKIASTPFSGDNYDISSSTFLVTFVGVYYADSSPMRQRYMVSTRVLADNSSDPYYELKGTDVLVTPLDADYLDGFDPTTDILLAIERDNAPLTDIWIKARQRNTDVYVTHLNGSTVDTLSSDVGWEILSGQAWAASTPNTASYSIVYGDWTSRQMKNLYTTGAEFRTYTDAPFSSTSVHQIPILPYINEVDTQPQRIVLCADGGSHDESGERVVQLPAKANSDKRIITIKDADGSASSSNIRVTGFSSETIDGLTDHYINNNYGAVTVICNGTQWLVLSVV